MNKLEQKKNISSKIFSMIYYVILLWVLLSFILNNGSGVPSVIRGMSGFCLQSDSMESMIPKDSLVITKTIEAENIEIGDIVTFMVGPTTSVTHRVVGIIESYNGTGQRGFETKGTENKKKDLGVIVPGDIIGKVVFQSVLMGKILTLFKEYWLWIFITFFICQYTVNRLLLIIGSKRSDSDTEKDNGNSDEKVVEEWTQIEGVIPRNSHELTNQEHEELFLQNLEEIKKNNRPWHIKIKKK